MLLDQSRFLFVALGFWGAISLSSCNGTSSFSQNGSELPNECYKEVTESAFSLELLDADIETRIASYLALEMGLSDAETDRLNLAYVGSGRICNAEIRIWSYSCAIEEVCYAAVQPWAEGYVISSSDRLPPVDSMQKADGK